MGLWVIGMGFGARWVVLGHEALGLGVEAVVWGLGGLGGGGFGLARGGFGLGTMGLGCDFWCVSGGQLGFVGYRVGFWGSVGRVWAWGVWVCGCGGCLGFGRA